MRGLQKLNQLLDARFLVSERRGEADRFFVEQLGQVHELPRSAVGAVSIAEGGARPEEARAATLPSVHSERQAGNASERTYRPAGTAPTLLGALEAERCVVVLRSARRATAVARLELALEDRLRERVLYPMLDDAAERPRAEDGVVAFVGEKIEDVRIDLRA
mgnify:CR=1 FL=1